MVQEERGRAENVQAAAVAQARCLEELPIRLSKNVQQLIRAKIQHFGSINDPAILRMVQRVLTGDASAAANSSEAERDERALMVLDEPELLDDFRKNNGGKINEKFEPFFDVMERKFAQYAQAAHERRHGEVGVSYFSEIISVPQLIRLCVETLKEENGDNLEAAGIEIPSTRWVRLQFQPKDNRRHAAVNYTGRFKVSYKLQVRQLRFDHVHAHYGNAAMRYQRCFAIMFRDHVIFAFGDDKSRAMVGPPENPMQSGTRNRAVPTVEGTELTAADHDFGGTAITPSMQQEAEIPEKIDGNWYHGQLWASLKDGVFEKSNPIRHCEELTRVFGPQIADGKSILLLLTDGGPDRNLTFASVQAPLLAAALKLDVDMLIVVRTVPKLSYRNPVERAMSLFNLGLQNVALSRDKMEDKYEDAIKGTNSLAAIRAVGERVEGFEEAFAKSMQSPIKIIEERFEQLEWTGNRVQTYKASTPEELSSLEQVFIDLDPAVFCDGLKGLDKKRLHSSDVVEDLYKQHVHVSRYCFQFIKKEDCTCKACAGGHIAPVRMPLEAFRKLG